MRVVALALVVLSVASAPRPANAETLVEQYRRAVAVERNLKAKYADDEASIQAPISDRAEGWVLVFGPVLCRNFDSPHCPSPAKNHNVKVEKPYSGDIESGALLRGTYYYLRRSTSKNSFGAEVPLLVYGIPDDLRNAAERVATLEREAKGRGLDPSTGESLQEIRARKDEEARRAKEAQKSTDFDTAKKRGEWAVEREKVRPGSKEFKMGFLFLMEEYPEGCLVSVEVPYPKATFDVLVRKDLPPELFGYCNYQKRVPIEENISFCQYLREKGHQRGKNGMFQAAWLATYPCYDGKVCLLSLESATTGTFPCPKKTSPTAVANPFGKGPASQKADPSASSPSGRSSPQPVRADSPKVSKNAEELARIQRDIDRETESLTRAKEQLASETRIYEQNLQDTKGSGSNPASTISHFNEMKAVREKRIKELEGKISSLEARKAEPSAKD